MRCHEKLKGTIMNNFGQNVPEMPSVIQTIFELVVFLWVAASLVAIGLAFWIYKDAESRGKNGAAAALIVLLSVFFYPPFAIIVLCTWILLRPENTPRRAANLGQHLPDTLPSEIVATAASTEFLKHLEENT
jgi:cytochrome bd-type quinol oxidase subunit 2